MERRRAGGSGVWGRRQTFASGRPSSPPPPEAPWEEGQESPMGGDDFHIQMDNNGVIGLDEASAEGREDLPWNTPGGPELEDEDLLEDVSYALSELQDSDPLSQSPTPSLYEDHCSEDEGLVVIEDEGGEGYEEGGEDDGGEGEEEAESWVIHTPQAERLPERDRQLDMTDEEERESEDTDTRGRSKPPLSIAMGTRDERQGGDTVSVDSSPVGNSAQDISLDRFSGASTPLEEEDGRKGPDLDSPPIPHLPRGAWEWTAPTPHTPGLSHLLHFSTEQLDGEPGIEDETLPEGGFIESLPESRSSRLSHAPPAAPTPSDSKEEGQEGPLFVPQGQEEEEGRGGGGGGGTEAHSSWSLPPPRQLTTPSPRKIKTQSPSMHLSAHKARTPHPEPSPHIGPESGVRRSHRAPREGLPKFSPGSPDSDHDRKGQLSFPLPDFSKVGPRVCFPKGGTYRPPKSCWGAARSGASRVTERPLVFKSPADIVKEVLMSDGDPTPPSVRRHVDVTVPQEFRSPKQASALAHQLQEDYNRLLTKYAEAENTIDRLRLEAKVGLYSDPPKPNHSVQSGTVHRSSKVMTITFPQAQRAKFSGDAVPAPPGRPDPEQLGTAASGPSASSSSRSLGPQFGERLSKDLSTQADLFQAQLDSFEDLLKKRKLKRFELMKGVASLVLGQDSLERGYLRAQDEHRVMQQQGRELGPFDPDRDVEGHIFRLGMRLEELREGVEQTVQEYPKRPTSLPSPPLAFDPLSGPLGTGGPTPHPESPVSPVRGGFGETVGAEVSSVSGESEGEFGGEPGEGLPSGLPPALHHKHHVVERDFTILLDHYQSFRRLPGLLDVSLTQGTMEADSAMVQMAPPGHDGMAPGCGRTESEEGRRSLSPVWCDGSEEVVLSPPPGPAMEHSDRLLREPLPQPLPFPGQQGGEERQVGRKSRNGSLASLGGSTASERQASKRHARRTTAPPQDGLTSPETDSGFVGSETSRLTPAAGGLPPQGERASHSVHLEERGENAQPMTRRPASDSTPGPTPQRPALRGRVGGPLCTPRVPRSGQGSRGHSLPQPSPSASSSPQHWASSLTSGFEPETNSLSEGEEPTNQQPVNQEPRHQRSPSPAVPRHHSDPLRAPGSGQLTSRHEAIQSLQDEVIRLKERLEGSLRCPNPHSLIRPPPSASEDSGRPRSIHARTRSSQRWEDGGREEAENRKRAAEREVQKGRREPPKPAPRKRSASVPQRRSELDITTDSEHAQSNPKARSSRRIPEASAAQGGRRQARSEATLRGPYTSQLYRLTTPGGGEEAEGREGSSHACPKRAPRHDGKQPAEGAVASDHSLLRRCPLCRGSDWDRGRRTEPGPSTVRLSAPQVSQPMASAHSVGGVFLVGPPPPAPVVPCVPVCPPVLYFSSPILKRASSYSQPLYLSLDGGVGLATIRSQGGDRRHTRSDHRALSHSLSRAIQAARDTRTASRTIARSLATGLHQQGVLTQSYLH